MPEAIPVVRQSFFFKFDDYRDPKSGKGHVVEQSSKNVYNHVSNWTDTDQRINFTKLFFSQTITAPLMRIPFKLYDLLTGGPIRRGIANAKHEFRILKVENNGKVSKLAYPLLLAKNILLSLAKDIAKIVTYPLNMIALQFAALLGMISPLDGWVIYSKIENYWSYDNSLQTYKAAGCCKDVMMIYSAPCMQTQQSYKKHNLYPLLGSYLENDLRSLRLRISRELERYSVYFGPTYDNLQTMTEKLSHRIAKVLKAKEKFTTIEESEESYQKMLDMRQSLKSLLNRIDKILVIKDTWLDKIQQRSIVSEPDPTPQKVAQMQKHLAVLTR